MNRISFVDVEYKLWHVDPKSKGGARKLVKSWKPKVLKSKEHKSISDALATLPNVNEKVFGEDFDPMLFFKVDHIPLSFYDKMTCTCSIRVGIENGKIVQEPRFEDALQTTKAKCLEHLKKAGEDVLEITAIIKNYRRDNLRDTVSNALKWFAWLEAHPDKTPEVLDDEEFWKGIIDYACEDKLWKFLETSPNIMM